jgi:DNA-binding PadR family transcriptional regulator
MGKRDFLGEFELLILLAILRLKDQAYGMRIRQEIEESCERETAIGSVYLTLERLEEKGFVESTLGEATEVRGGRAKRFFSVNRSGRVVLRRSLRAVSNLAEGLTILGTS